MSDRHSLYAVFGFDSTHDALLAENVLLAGGIEVALIPTPRALGSLCGFAVRVAAADRDRATSAFRDGGLDPNGEIELRDRTGS